MSKYQKIKYRRWFALPEDIIGHGITRGPVATLKPAELRMLVYLAGMSRGSDIELTNRQLEKFAALNHTNLRSARAALVKKRLIRAKPVGKGESYVYRTLERGHKGDSDVKDEGSWREDFPIV